MLRKKLLILCTTVLLLCSTYLPIHATDESITATIGSTYAIVIDRDTSQVLSEKNADERMYPASLTKMLTAMIAIENLQDLNQTIQITDAMLAGLKEENASVVGFQAGDTPTVQDILYGIALPSGADATNAVAYAISGSIDAFVQLMNEKAQQIGMTNSHFMNTTGLHDENHYSTARDMAILLQYCLQNETFQTVFSTHTYTTSPLQSAENGILLQSSLFRSAEINGYAVNHIIGGKTGFTYPAGHCLAAWEDINDMHLITVVANADVNATNAPHILDTTTILSQLQSWQKQTLVTTETPIKEIIVSHPFTKDDTITIYSPIDFDYDLANEAQVEITCTLPTYVSARNKVHTLTGDMEIVVNGETVYTQQITVQIDKENNIFNQVAIWLSDIME